MLVVGSVAALCCAVGVGPAAAKSTKRRTVLAKLTVESPAVRVKEPGKPTFTTAKNGQTLRHGDEIRTDATGRVEIDYTDGSLTRLGPSSDFTILTLTDKRGARRTKGVLEVGEAWSRVVKLSESSSFEMETSNATAAVQGTAFAVECKTAHDCKFIDLVDDVELHIDRPVKTHHHDMELAPDTDVVVDVGAHDHLKAPMHESPLSLDDASHDPWIMSNVMLDQEEGVGNGRGDLPPSTTTTVPSSGGSSH